MKLSDTYDTIDDEMRNMIDCLLEKQSLMTLKEFKASLSKSTPLKKPFNTHYSPQVESSLLPSELSQVIAIVQEVERSFTKSLPQLIESNSLLNIDESETHLSDVTARELDRIREDLATELSRQFRLDTVTGSTHTANLLNRAPMARAHLEIHLRNYLRSVYTSAERELTARVTSRVEKRIKKLPYSSAFENNLKNLIQANLKNLLDDLEQLRKGIVRLLCLPMGLTSLITFRAYGPSSRVFAEYIGNTTEL